jgi:hypothetical protein
MKTKPLAWKIAGFSLLCFTIIIFTFSCQKEVNSNSILQGQQHVRIMMSDDPIPHDSVNSDWQR